MSRTNPDMQACVGLHWDDEVAVHVRVWSGSFAADSVRVENSSMSGMSRKRPQIQGIGVCRDGLKTVKCTGAEL